MAALSFVVFVDGFQHGSTEPFKIKCLAVACGKTQSTYMRQFDTTDLLDHSSDALWTYRSQNNYHGLPIASPGLPRDTAPVVLFHGIQDILLQLLQTGATLPSTIVLWTKGSAKHTFLTSLVQNSNLPMALCVRNLEDVGCPPAWNLSTQLFTMGDKARIPAEWLIHNDLDHNPAIRRRV